MGTKQIVGIASASGIIVVAMIITLMVIGYQNKYVTTWNQLEAQQEACKVVQDNTWKIISQKAQVADQYKDAFSEVYPALMEGRYGNEKGGALLKFVTESNPNFDVALYRDLGSAIEAQRSIFTREQKTLIDLKRELDNLRQMFPSSIVVGGKPTYEIKVITSSKTEDTYVTGKEDDVNLFDKKD